MRHTHYVNPPTRLAIASSHGRRVGCGPAQVALDIRAVRFLHGVLLTAKIIFRPGATDDRRAGRVEVANGAMMGR